MFRNKRARYADSRKGIFRNKFGGKNSWGGYAKQLLSRTPQNISENVSLFGGKTFFVNRLPKGNFRGYAYPPKFSQASRRPKSRHPLLGGYAQKLFCVPRYAKTISRTCYAHLGGTLVPKHRVRVFSPVFNRASLPGGGRASLFAASGSFRGAWIDSA